MKRVKFRMLSTISFISIAIGSLFVLGGLRSMQAAAISEFQSQPLMNSLYQFTPIDTKHPYADNTNEFWVIENNSSLNAIRIHFERIEIEEDVERIELRDANDVLFQVIKQNHPNGLWSDIVPGAAIKVIFKSDGPGQYWDRFWGFRIDKIESVSYAAVSFSSHPYSNSYSGEVTLLNDTPKQNATRVHFDRIELENKVDHILIKDLNDVVYQSITGIHPNGFTSKAVPGPAIKIQLVSDSSVQAWGYNIDAVEGVDNADTPDEPVVRDALAESDHPYTQVDRTWIVTNPDPAAVSSKLHISRLELLPLVGCCDSRKSELYILDADDNLIQVFYSGTSLTNIWTDYIPGRIVKLRLITQKNDGWGFKVDMIVNSEHDKSLAESNHPYAPVNQTWILTNPDPNAASSKIHFSRFDLLPFVGCCDKRKSEIQILDANNTIIQIFPSGTNLRDAWTDYVPGRLVKVKFIAEKDGGWGFRVNKIRNSVSHPGLVQSDHPYTILDKTWSITNPRSDADFSRLHFSRIELLPLVGCCDNKKSEIQILDANDTVIQVFPSGTNLFDVWTDYVPGRVVKLRFTVQKNGGWGFRADAIESSNPSAETPTPTNIPTQVPTPIDTPIPTAQPTATPIPTNTPVPPTATPTPGATSAAPPTIREIRPDQGRNDATNELTVYGDNFKNGAMVRLNDLVLTTAYIDDDLLRADVPTGLAAGVYDVTVTNPDDGSAKLSAAYTVFDAVNNDDLFGHSYELWTEPLSPRAQSKTKLYLVVHRQGGKNAVANLKVHFYLGNPQSGGTLIDESIIPAISPRSFATTPGVEWTPPDSGDYQIYALIDPENLLAETYEDNNLIGRTITVLAAAADELAPHVDSFTINNGAASTTNPVVKLSTVASDPEPGSGVSKLLFVEHEYSVGAEQWVPVRSSGWLDYATVKSDYEWRLLPASGMKYLYAWAADAAGNVSQFPYKASINFMPESHRVGANQRKLYRYALTAGETLYARIEPISGDPDLYIWAPDHETRPPWISNLQNAIDDVSVVAPVDGTYQIEVYGFASAEYRIVVEISSTERIGSAAINGGIDPTKVVPAQPSLPNGNEPNLQMGIESPGGSQPAFYLPLIAR